MGCRKIFNAFRKYIYPGLVLCTLMLLLAVSYRNNKLANEARRERIEIWEAGRETVQRIQEILLEEIRGGNTSIVGDGARLFALVCEKAVLEYTREGLVCFRGSDYQQAYDMFSRALKYQPGNTTLRFYQAYALYLGSINEALTESRGEMILGAVREIERCGYQAGERLDFSEEEMRQKGGEMAKNIQEKRRQEGFL